MCKLFSSEVAERVTSLAVNLFGGYGFVKDYPVEKLYRDAKIGQNLRRHLHLQLQTIAKQLLVDPMASDFRHTYLRDIIKTYRAYKSMGEKALAQVADADLHRLSIRRPIALPSSSSTWLATCDPGLPTF